MKGRPAAKHCIQYAALPYRLDDDGLQILLVTSRETKRWIVPKGWPERGLKPHKLAALEAREEAGVVGRAGRRAIGRFDYQKRMAGGHDVPCTVLVYPLIVERELPEWREKDERERRWMTPGEAAMSVSEAGLIELILRLGAPTP